MPTRPEQTSGLGSRKVKISASHSISPPFRASFLSYSSRPGPTSGGRKAQAFLGELDNHHQGPVDTSGGVRNEDLILVLAASVPDSQEFTYILGGSRCSLGGGDSESLTKASYSALTPQFSRVPQHNICGAKEGRELETHHQPESSQSLCDHLSVQVGDHPEPEGCAASGRLYGEARHERCLSNSPSPQVRLEIPEVHVEGRSIRIYYPAVRTGTSPSHLRQAPQTSDSLHAADRCQNYDLPRRILIMAPSPKETYRGLHTVLHILTHLGVVINHEKCIVVQTQIIEFLGFTLNSIQMVLSLPQDKVCKIKNECRHMCNQEEVSGRSLAHLIGVLTACIPAIQIAPLHCNCSGQESFTVVSWITTARSRYLLRQ